MKARSFAVLVMAFRLVGTAFTVATFPGLVVAAAIQDGVVDLVGVPASVTGDGPGAYRAEYDAVASARTAVVVTFLPSLACSVVAASLLAVAVAGVRYWTLGWWMCSWLGLAVGAHAFPDPEAALALDHTSANHRGVTRRVGTALGSAVRVAAALSLFRADLLYAALLYYAVSALLLPGTPPFAVPVPLFG